MNEQTLSGAAQLTRIWVSAYTRGIPTGLRDRRRAEIDSDLWEHNHYDRDSGRPAFEHSLEIVVRLLLGIPADLSWRLEQASPKRSAARIYQGSRTMLQTASRNAIPLLVGLLAPLYVAFAIASGVSGDFNSTGGHVLYSTLLGVAGILLAAGLIGLKRMPLAASLAIATGAILGGVLTFWLILTLAAALLILVWLLLGSRRRRNPATA